MPDQRGSLFYPDPPLTDGAVVLRRWTKTDLGCVEEASREGRIPEGTTVPGNFTIAEGVAWIERQWARAANGTGLSQAVVAAGSDRCPDPLAPSERPRVLMPAESAPRAPL